MTDFNTTSFLTELDSFGQPPPQQKLITGDDRKQQFTHKLDKINIKKQQVRKFEFLGKMTKFQPFGKVEKN